MTWKELLEKIQLMTEEEQNKQVMLWAEYDYPKPVIFMDKIDRNIFIVDDYDNYCDELYAKEHPENTKLVLNKNDYYLHS